MATGSLSGVKVPNRRTFLSSSVGASLGVLAADGMQPASSGEGSGVVNLKWLAGAAPPLATGVSWGVPWPRGTVSKTQNFSLNASDGTSLPLQHWPLAYWPDGTLKWSGFATVADNRATGLLKLSTNGSTGSPSAVIQTKDSADAIDIDAGRIRCRIPRKGSNFVESLAVDGKVVATHGRLVCSLEDRSGLDSRRTIHFEDFTSEIGKVTVEQTGPVRAVIKIEGMHKSNTGSRKWLPFVVRLYFYSGGESIRLVHSIVFDGDDQKDFISALGVVFSVPMREQVHNRHVRFSGQDAGLWAEPCQPIAGRRPLSARGQTRNYYAEQLQGKRVPNREEFDAQGQNLLKDWAVWDSFKLVQQNANGFKIQKRTNPQSCWLDSGAGERASGLVFAGDVSGGLAISIRNFWQSHPSSLEVRKATTDAADVYAWLWSPDAAAMDLRHYDTKAHGLDASYEDVQPGFSTAHGVGRTSELTLFPTASVPERETSIQQAAIGREVPLLVCTPEHFHSAGVLGIWGLPDRSNATASAIEDRLASALAFYQKEVEQRSWYGFWDFGDVMHAYDATRHVWRYDIGGFAWDNTELATDMWLWCSFLRTGSADVFRMAEAMTRHTSEVDSYHLGRFAMLGSRHNVRHWGCGAKEARISQAAFRRYHYYLTTDERTGDVMREVLDVDTKVMEIDPMRLAMPRSQLPTKYPGRVRGGPDWLAFVGNWMTEWERTGNTKYRDKIIAGMDCIAKMPYGFLTGPNSMYGYDPATGKLYPLAADPFGGYNLQVIQGGAELVFELNELIDHPGWKKAWLQYCRLTRAPEAVVKADLMTGTEGSSGEYTGGARLAAYVYHETREPAFAKAAFAELLKGTRTDPGANASWQTRQIAGPEVLRTIDETPGVSTNSTAQNSLNAIQVLAMCADQFPA